MPSLLETYQVPLWAFILVTVAAVFLWIEWSKALYNKFLASKFLNHTGKNFSGYVDFDDLSEDMSAFQKFTVQGNESAVRAIKKPEIKNPKRESEVITKQQSYVKNVLKTIALNGDKGILIQSIADNLDIKSNEVKKILSYLEKNNLVEAVVAASGNKYYLAARGKKYCIQRNYITR